MRVGTHKDERGVQIFIVSPLKVPVVFFHLPLELIVELHPGVSSRSSAAQHGLQGIVKGLFQPFVIQ